MAGSERFLPGREARDEKGRAACPAASNVVERKKSDRRREIRRGYGHYTKIQHVS